MKTIKTFNSFSLNENIEYEKRLSQPIIDILNEQIGNELQSSQIYRGMSCFLDDKGFTNAGKYFFKSGQEELVHMDRIYNYLFDKNCKPKVPKTTDVKQDFTNIVEILKLSLEHEILVSKNWNDIADLALKEKDNFTYQEAQWFINEQVEEENKWRELLFEIDTDTPKWKISDIFEELIKK
jgi:ferritin